MTIIKAVCSHNLWFIVKMQPHTKQLRQMF